MLKPEKIIVIGGNAAGPAAAAKAKRVNPSSDVLMFEEGEFVSTGTCEIPYVLSGDIKDYNKIVFFDANSFKEKKGVDVFIKHRVEEIQRKEKIIVVKDLKNNININYEYDKLIIATGSKPKTLPNFKPETKNLFLLKSVKDLIKIQKFIKSTNSKRAIIIGSGYIGLETADALSKLNFEISIFEKDELPLTYAEPEIQNKILELLKKNNIRFFNNTVDYKINYSDNSIKSFTYKSRIIESDFVLIAVGFSPNNDLAKKSNLDIGRFGGINVDNKLRTSDQHIYACGDCIEVKNFITNQPEYIPLATLAHEYGHVAGENAAGGNTTVNPVIKNIALKVFDKFLVRVGLTEEEAIDNKFYVKTVSAETSNLIPLMPESEKTFGKLIYDNNSQNILGASFLGGREVEGYGNLIAGLIYSKQPANVLTRINFNYTPPLSPFINLLSVLGRKIENN